jgi:hypothetical protein
MYTGTLEERIIAAIKDRNPKFAMLYIIAGNNLNAKDKDGTHALTLAIRNGLVGIAHFLIEKGVHFEQIDKFGKTPIFYAVELGITSVTQALINAKANVHVRDEHNRSLLDRALTKGHTDIVNLLLPYFDINKAKILGNVDEKAKSHPFTYSLRKYTTKFLNVFQDFNASLNTLIYTPIALALGGITAAINNYGENYLNRNATMRNIISYIPAEARVYATFFLLVTGVAGAVIGYEHIKGKLFTKQASEAKVKETSQKAHSYDKQLNPQQSFELYNQVSNFKIDLNTYKRHQLEYYKNKSRLLSKDPNYRLLLNKRAYSSSEILASKTYIDAPAANYILDIKTVFEDLAKNDLFKLILDGVALMSNPRFNIALLDHKQTSNFKKHKDDQSESVGHYNGHNTVAVALERKWEDFKGSLVHELGHFLFHKKYHNACNPYKADNNDAKAAFSQAIKTSLMNIIDSLNITIYNHESAANIDSHTIGQKLYKFCESNLNVLRRCNVLIDLIDIYGPSSYEKKNEHPEFAVRYLQILAKGTDTNNLLAPIKAFFDKYIIPDLKTFINTHPMRDVLNTNEGMER